MVRRAWPAANAVPIIMHLIAVPKVYRSRASAPQAGFGHHFPLRSFMVNRNAQMLAALCHHRVNGIPALATRADLYASINNMSANTALSYLEFDVCQGRVSMHGSTPIRTRIHDSMASIRSRGRGKIGSMASVRPPAKVTLAPAEGSLNFPPLASH
jgi:hypothetical protein